MYKITNIMINIIYGLRDPRNDVYQYIGKSTVGTKRALQHLTESHSEKVNNWVKTLNNNWLYPKVDIIEEVDNIDDLPEREKYWVNYYYDINPSLLNIQLIDDSIFKIRNEEDELDFNNIVRLYSKLPTILKNERLYRNITQKEMAKKMGVNRWTISSFENGNSVTTKIVQKYILTLKGIDIKTKLIRERTNRISVDG